MLYKILSTSVIKFGFVYPAVEATYC